MWRARAALLHYLKLDQVMSRWMNLFIRAANSHYSAAIRLTGEGGVEGGGHPVGPGAP